MESSLWISVKMNNCLALCIPDQSRMFFSQTACFLPRFFCIVCLEIFVCHIEPFQIFYWKIQILKRLIFRNIKRKAFSLSFCILYVPVQNGCLTHGYVGVTHTFQLNVIPVIAVPVIWLNLYASTMYPEYCWLVKPYIQHIIQLPMARLNRDIISQPFCTIILRINVILKGSTQISYNCFFHSFNFNRIQINFW